MTLLSKTWHFSARALISDMVKEWSINGQKDWRARLHPANILGFELLVADGPTPTWLMIGTTYADDIFLKTAGRHERHMLPLPIPTTPEGYIDLHAKYRFYHAQRHAGVLLTAYYTVN